MTRIVVAEGNEIIQHGLLTILQQEASFTVVAVAQQGAEALAACRSLRPDVLLLNPRLPDVDGLGVARQVSLLQRGPRILLLSAVSDALLVQAAREARVQGYLLQSVSAATVRDAIHRIMHGERVFAGVMQPENGARVALSPQEAATLRYLAEGLRTREIAQQMACCPRTVEVYLSHIYAKLGVSSRLEAVTLARRQGLLTSE